MKTMCLLFRGPVFWSRNLFSLGTPHSQKRLFFQPIFVWEYNLQVDKLAIFFNFKTTIFFLTSGQQLKSSYWACVLENSSAEISSAYTQYARGWCKYIQSKMLLDFYSMIMILNFLNSSPFVICRIFLHHFRYNL